MKEEKYVISIAIILAVPLLLAGITTEQQQQALTTTVSQIFDVIEFNSVSGELGAGARVANYSIPASVGNNTTTLELLQYAYNQGLIIGRQAGPAGIEDSANSAVCPNDVDLWGDYCKAMVRGYEDGFAQTCVPAKDYGYGCPPERRMHQPIILSSQSAYQMSHQSFCKGTTPLM